MMTEDIRFQSEAMDMKTKVNGGGRIDLWTDLGENQ